MVSNIVKIILVAMITIGVFGCAQDLAKKSEWDSQLDRNWGRSFEAAKYNQTLNPEAGKNTEPVVGIEGPAAERIMNGYTSGGAPKKKSSSDFGVVTIKQ